MNVNKEQFNFLKKLNAEIKSGNLVRMQNAFEELKNFNSDDSGILMYSKYLKGKFFYLSAKINSSLENYAKAHLCFKKVFDIARNNRKFVRNPKYHFKYAESAFRLSDAVWCNHQRNDYESLAFSIAANAIMLYPNNDSIKWLMSELTK
ncbi:hypothetical protein [uncultured Psychroserpens sp.]|uniref:hypothetical protein n=1 Tax=uncultured Psychroserpens sp. TaxID=255436 RepID=UPI002621DE34|nr:hypothetical protein [uncultured Psychroserpens sp.]